MFPENIHILKDILIDGIKDSLKQFRLFNYFITLH